MRWLLRDVIVTFYNALGLLDTAGNQLTTAAKVATNQLQCFVKYTLYDGPDALIANKLLEMGITVNPSNVDWYKRSLLEQQSRAAQVAANGNGGVA